MSHLSPEDLQLLDDCPLTTVDLRVTWRESVLDSALAELSAETPGQFVALPQEYQDALSALADAQFDRWLATIDPQNLAVLLAAESARVGVLQAKLDRVLMSDAARVIEDALLRAWHRLPETYRAPELPTSLILRDLAYATHTAIRERVAPPNEAGD